MEDRIITPDERGTHVVSWGFLGGWLCVCEDATDAEIDDCILAARESFALPVHDLALVRDRLFGGFGCDKSGRCHVYVSVGDYTFLHPENNTPMTPADREERWRELLAHNGDNFHGRGPFTQDVPSLTEIN